MLVTPFVAEGVGIIMVVTYPQLSPQQRLGCLDAVQSLSIKQEESRKPRWRFVFGFHF